MLASGGDPIPPSAGADDMQHRSRPKRLQARTVGLISDTHGLLRPEVQRALVGSDLILHAGDIGDPAILSSLALIAPVVAVRGNNDRNAWADGIPYRLTMQIRTLRVHMLHDLKELEPAQGAFDVVICGHSHRPSVHEREGVLYINPGSAGPRRFKLPVSIGYLELLPTGPAARIVELL